MLLDCEEQGPLHRSKHGRSPSGRRGIWSGRSAVPVSRRDRAMAPLLERCEERVLMAFGLSKLLLGSATGLEDYVYTVGNKIVPQAVGSGKYYDIVVTDSNGLQRNIIPRTPTGSFTT